MISSAWIYGMTAFLAVALIMPLARRIALATGFVDHPGGRKKHDEAVPPIGGLVIFPVFIMISMFQQPSFGEHLYFYFALLLLVVTGAWDDRFNVAPRVKFFIQILAACLIVLPGGAQVIMMGNMFGFGPFGLNFMAVPFSIIAVVLLINAVNLMDGLDGLAGGKSFIVLAWLLVAAIVTSSSEFIGPLVTMLGVIGGFLVYNLRHPMRARASVFLGDSGSMALGLTLGWYCIHGAAGHDSLVQPVSVAWLLALPIMDTCGQFARRVSQGRHPFDADHDHFHHHFIYAGFPVSKATAFILGLSFIAGLIGVVGLWAGLPEAVLTYPWIAWLFVHIYLSMRPHRFRRIVAKLNRNNQKTHYE